MDGQTMTGTVHYDEAGNKLSATVQDQSGKILGEENYKIPGKGLDGYLRGVFNL